jgi:hypothetical protein
MQAVMLRRVRRSRLAPAATRRAWAAPLLALAVAVGLLAGLSGCTPYHGPLTNLGDVDQYLPARWNPDPSRNQVEPNAGIYPMPSHHLILVHVQIPDTSVTALGPGAVRGAVGVWWIALDDRVPGGDGKLVWIPSCDRFKTTGKGASYDLAGDYLNGPATANLSRYPLEFNPDDGSVSVALSQQDEITISRSGSGGAAPYLPPANQACSASA